ncbi:MAG: hypothetical protein HYY05_04505 [Chloroflexi bacterium]|nr:hypothetical protein [Chloroflexota bacterium]
MGPVGLGILVSANGAGALIGSLGVAALSGFPRPAALQLGLGVGFGLGLACFALAPFFPLAVAIVLIVGLTSAAYTSLNNTMIMGHTDPRLYGRVMSVYQLTFAMMPFGALPIAWLADQVGGRVAVAGAGLVVAAIVAGVAALYTPYRHIR